MIDNNSAGFIIVMVGVMWVFQMYFTYRQAMKFNATLKSLRQKGRTAIGMGGKRYRGGRAFVSIAEKSGIVVDARVMSGFTVLAAPKTCPELIGLSLTQLAEGGNIPGLKDKVVGAAQMAAETLLKPEKVSDESLVVTEPSE